MKPIIFSLLSVFLISTLSADDTLGDDIVLEDIGDTLDSSELEIDQMSTPDLPDEVLPGLFKENNTEVSEPTEAETETDQGSSEKTLPDNVKVNYVNVSETFYKVTFNSETNIYSKEATSEANPGDLIEIVVTAVNASDETVTNVEMVNTIPTGPVTLIEGSFKSNFDNSLYLISRNGQDFFPSDADIDTQSIKYIQWLIFALKPNESIEFSYRIQIDK